MRQLGTHGELGFFIGNGEIVGPQIQPDSYMRLGPFAEKFTDWTTETETIQIAGNAYDLVRTLDQSTGKLTFVEIRQDLPNTPFPTDQEQGIYFNELPLIAEWLQKQYGSLQNPPNARVYIYLGQTKNISKDGSPEFKNNLAFLQLPIGPNYSERELFQGLEKSLQERIESSEFMGELRSEIRYKEGLENGLAKGTQVVDQMGQLMYQQGYVDGTNKAFIEGAKIGTGVGIVGAIGLAAFATGISRLRSRRKQRREEYWPRQPLA